ncbi:hypothetical protein VTO73DRAFT_13750 [Trametes versicolor]
MARFAIEHWEAQDVDWLITAVFQSFISDIDRHARCCPFTCPRLEAFGSQVFEGHYLPATIRVKKTQTCTYTRVDPLDPNVHAYKSFTVYLLKDHVDP